MKQRHTTIRIDLDQKEGWWYIDVINGKTMRSGGVAFAEKSTGKNGTDLRKILRRIKETLYL